MVGQRGIPKVFYGALALGCLSGPALAAEGELMRDAMSSIGLIEPERPVINYNERAPLVMPPGLGGGKGAKAPAKRPAKDAKGAAKGTQPSADADAGQGQLMSLPPPQARQAADPQWPKDPEVTLRERAAAEDRKPRGFSGTQGRMDDNNMTLSPTEMAAGRRSGADAPGSHKSDREASWFEPLSALLGRKSDEGAEPSAVEPSRDILTDPPTGYRKAPVKVVRQQGGPIGGSISGNEEADPGAYLREQNKR